MYIIVYHDDADENEDAVSAPVVFGHKEALFGEWGQSCTSSAALDCILLHYYCNIALLYFCTIVLLSSPRAKRAGPKGLRAESARAVTGRRCPHSGVG